MNCTTCSIGIKGARRSGQRSEGHLPGGFSVRRHQRNTGEKQDSLTDRDQWIGLETGYGTVRAGTISTVYKSHGAMIDPFYRTALQGSDRGLQSSYFNSDSSAGEELQGRAENTLRWDSPDWNGIQVGAFYTLDNDENDGEDEDPYGIGASYSNDKALVFADYVDNNQSDSDGLAGGAGEITAWKVGGKYGVEAFGFNFGLMGQYEDATTNNGITETDLTVWHVGGTLTLGNTMAYLAIGKGEIDPSGSSSDDYNAWTLAAMHSLSKRTKLYAGFSEVDCDVQVQDTACNDVGSSGGEDDKFSLGMQHKF